MLKSTIALNAKETGEKGLNRKLLDYTFLIKLSKYFSIYHPTSPNIYIFI